MSAKQRSANFTETEKERLEELIATYPVIEDKRKECKIEEEKRKAWESIWSRFNSNNEEMDIRNISQIKVS